MTGTRPRHCPALSGYDPLHPAELSDPYPSFSRARREAPVFYDEKYGFWTVTRYEDIVAILADTNRFSSRMAIPMPLPPEDLRERMPVYPFQTAILFMDDPQHRGARAMVQAPFVPRRLKEREPKIHARARELLVERVGSRIEFIKEYSLPLALTVIGDLVGVPQRDWPLLEESIYGAFRIGRIASGVVNDAVEIRELAEGQARYWDYLVALAEERRQNPTDDFSSVLAAQVNPNDGSGLTAQEIAAHINTMIGAGFVTSAQMLTWGAHSILTHRDQWELLKSDRSLLPSAVEECVRFRTLTKRSFRVTNVAVDIGNVTIPRGALVAMSHASANHDEAIFDNPDRFDVRRPIAPRNLTFGRGMHHCLGAPLAKAEMRITLETLMELAPESDIPAQKLTWQLDFRHDLLETMYIDLRRR
jgi:cytochrome P450